MTLIAYVRDTMTRPTVPADYVAPEPSWRRIVRETADKHGLTAAELLSQTHARRVAWPRQEAMYRMRTELELSFPAIAARFNLKHHTTVMYGIKKHAQRIAG